ncbi:hypothetical protein [Peribacillus kribbensis]|uniref:hypothetical protein n=1 Tax=Peribacillus kribbensis TaxID=356658 RepID=UPI000404A280|nr:hypothetical protein [Peribacillus kribbensis]
MKSIYGAVIAAVLLTGCQGAQETGNKAEEAGNKVKEESKKAVDELDKKTQPAQDKVKKEVENANLGEKSKKAVDSVKTTMNDTKKKAEKKILEKGEKATVDQDAFLALSEGEYDKLYQFIKINDYDGVSDQINKNKVVELKKGSEVTVLSRMAVRIEVVDESSKKKGYIPSTLLTPKK